MINVETKSLKNYTFIDLFAGIGGFHYALNSFGAKCVFASEIDKKASEIYYLNHKTLPKGDITKINEKEIPKHDILCGGFPCQAFSISGKQKGFEDTRGTLFFDIARIVNYHKPKILFLENVKNFVKHDKGKTLENVIKTLEDMNYTVFYKVLNTSSFGLPQNRERVYIVAFNNNNFNNIKFKFPNPNIISCLEDILEEKPENAKVINRSDILFYKNLYTLRNIFGEIELPNKPFQIGKVNKGGQGERIYHPKGHAITLSAYGGGVGSKTGLYKIKNKIRKLSTRECARIQGFPKSFIIPKSVTEAQKQFGNSVSINTLQFVLKEITETILENDGRTKNRFTNSKKRVQERKRYSKEVQQLERRYIMNKPKTNVLRILTICFLIICTQSCNSREKRIEKTTEKHTSTAEVKNRAKTRFAHRKKTTANEVAKLSKVVFYLENSGSMFGYVKGFSQYVEVVSELAEKPEFAEEYTPREFNLINGGKDIKITEIGNDPSVLKNRLNENGFRCGDIKKSNLNDMFRIALKRAKEDTISILISDGIYDLQKPQSPMNALAIESSGTRSRFIERLSEGGVQTLMIKMNSHFKGKYYNAKQQAILLDQDRPYYIWIFGNSDLLNKYFPDEYIASLKGYSDMARFLKYENDLVNYKVVSNNHKGKFRFDKYSKNKLIDVEPDRNSNGFQFSIAADFSNLPFSDSYLNAIVNYDCNNTNYNVCEVTNIGNIKIYGLDFTPTHLISIHTNKRPYGEIEIFLKNNIPNWIAETNINDERGIKGDSNHTFGFEFLTKGISGAYTHINQNTNLAKFTILINK